jgi:Kef-type K+ transport system membrane component KefB
MDPGTTFSTAHIGVTAALVGLATLVIVVALDRPVRPRLVAGVVLTTTAGTFAWRMVANVGALNEDGVSWVSANDVLAPMLTYLLLGMYAAFVPPSNADRFERIRCLLAGVALVINVIAI